MRWLPLLLLLSGTAFAQSPTYLGTVTATATSGTDRTQDITIPEGTTFVAVLMSYYETAMDPFLGTTIEDEALTVLIDEETDEGNTFVGVYAAYITDVTTGAGQEFEWQWSSVGTPNDGDKYFITFWSGVDDENVTAYFDRDDAAGSVGLTATTAVGDVVLAHTQRQDSGSAELASSGSPTITAIVNDDVFNDESIDLDYFVAETTSYDLSVTSPDYSSLMVLVLPGVGGGSQSPVPVILQQH